MNPRDTSSASPVGSEMVVSEQDYTDKQWVNRFGSGSPVNTDIFEQHHTVQLSEHSTLSPGSGKRMSPPLEHELGCNGHFLTYNPIQQQPALSYPSHSPTNSGQKHGSHSLHDSQQDLSFRQQKRLYHNSQQNSQPRQEHERIPSSGGGTSVHGSFVSPPEGGYDYFIQDLPSQQGNQSHPQHLIGSQSHVHHHQRSMSGSHCMPNDTFAVQKSHHANRRRMTKEKVSKGDREEVWPPDVENAFMKALEVLPKLGRRKVLVNGKPCGRNELIADFIYKQTNKIRDRKQVSSHIQVLKNTRKNETAFMRLLTDYGDGEDDVTLERAPSVCASASHSPAPSHHLCHGRVEHTPAGDKSTRPNTTPATSIPTLAQDFGDSLTLTIADTESLALSNHYNQHQYKGGSLTISGVDANDHPFVANAQSLYRQSATTPDSAVSLSSEVGPRDYVVFEQANRTGTPGHLKCSASVNWPREASKGTGMSRTVDPVHPLWPTAFRLCIQYSRVDSMGKHADAGDHDGGTGDNYGFDGSSPCKAGNVASDDTQSVSSTVGVHELAIASDLGHHALGTINIHQLQPEKFPALYDLYERATCAFLFLKIGMNLNLDLEGTFENTCLFDSGEGRALRCSTQIYSFGTKVLESSEVQQATIVSERFVHKFEFVNQFFNAFLSGIRTLATREEVEVALCNLSLLQVYEDLDPRVESTSPLLVMAFEFERGRGSVAPYRIIDGSDMLESLV